VTDSPLALTPDKLEALIDPGVTAPWHQREDEPDDAFEAFFFYRSLVGKRGRDKAFKQMLRVRNPDRLTAYKGRVAVPHVWALWQTTYYWDSRAKAWDDYVRRSLMSTELDHLEEMLTRHRDSLVKLQKGGMDYIEAHGFETAAAALRAIHHSMDREREMAGLPEISHLLVMSADELKVKYEVTVAKLSMSLTNGDND